MREILFKAKRIDNGEWVEGCLVTRRFCDNNKVFEAHIVVDAYEQANVLYYGSQPVLISPVTIDNEYDEDCFRVDINTICQYTGLTDKNGNKIWENDIIRYKEIYAIGKVVFMEDTLVLDDKYDGKQYMHGMWDKFEVISNIFDSAELLKKSEE